MIESLPKEKMEMLRKKKLRHFVIEAMDLAGCAPMIAKLQMLGFMSLMTHVFLSAGRLLTPNFGIPVICFCTFLLIATFGVWFDKLLRNNMPLEAYHDHPVLFGKDDLKRRAIMRAKHLLSVMSHVHPDLYQELVIWRPDNIKQKPSFSLKQSLSTLFISENLQAPRDWDDSREKFSETSTPKRSPKKKEKRSPLKKKFFSKSPKK